MASRRPPVQALPDAFCYPGARVYYGAPCLLPTASVAAKSARVRARTVPGERQIP